MGLLRTKMESGDEVERIFKDKVYLEKIKWDETSDKDKYEILQIRSDSRAVLPTRIFKVLKVLTLE